MSTSLKSIIVYYWFQLFLPTFVIILFFSILLVLKNPNVYLLEVNSCKILASTLFNPFVIIRFFSILLDGQNPQVYLLEVNHCIISASTSFTPFVFIHFFSILLRTLFVCFVALRPKSTAMAMAGRSVHLTAIFPWQA